MRKLLSLYVVTCALLFVAWQCFAQLPLTHGGLGAPASVGYTGPGDIQAFNVWCGLRAYTAATAGTKAIRVVRASDSTQQDINTLANGSLDAATLTSFLTSTTGKIVTCYDKVGTNNFTQATDANRPPVLANALNSSYGISCTGAAALGLGTGTNLGYAQPFTAVTVAERTSGTTSLSAALSGDSSNGVPIVGFSTSANNAAIYAGTIVSISAVNDNAFHGLNTSVNGASTIYQIDALTGTVNPGTSAIGGSGVGFICQTGNGSNNLTGVVMEVGLAATGVSAGVLSSLNSNEHSAYGGF